MNDYYVYLHKDTNDVVFYVGKGRRKRAYSKTNRSYAWSVFAENGFSVEFVKTGITEQEAKSVERLLIQSPENDWNLTNVRSGHNSVEYPYDLLHKIVEYSEDSPTFLRWKIKVGNCDKVKQAGDAAGYLSYFKDGKPKQSVFTFNNQKYFIHRVIWCLSKQDIDSSYVINHKDNNPHNNSIGNLEICSHAHNARRRKEHTGEGLNKRNKTGVNGVTRYLDKSKTFIEYFLAYYNDLNGVMKSKRFSVSKYGEEEAFRLACEWRKQKIEELNAAGAGYTDRHGT